MPNKGVVNMQSNQNFIRVKDMPDYSNWQTKATEEKMSPFVFDETYCVHKNVVSKEPYMFENGSIYYGEWNSKNQREGKGTQFW